MASKNGTIQFASRSEAGVKGFNQDALAIPPDEVDQQSLGTCLAVADGITLCAKGGELAEAAVKIVENYYNIAKEGNAGEVALDQALEKLWLDFFLKVENDNDEDYLLSGTTLTVALIFRGRIHLRHLGDSHCDIFLPDGTFNRLTQEHSTPDGSLLNYFGGELQTPAQEETAEFPSGSKLILSSDGISYFIETELMQNLGEKFSWKPEELIEEMFTLSDQAGSIDDKTLVFGY